MSDSNSWHEPGSMGKSDSDPIAANPDIEVWAAGGVIWRVVEQQFEVLLVHREHRADWSFPKGKLDEDESLKACARREVEEETGLQCELGTKFELVRYRDGRGRHKAVVYWSMTVVDGAFVPNDEVDACGWFDLASARAVLTYRRDGALVDEIERRVSSSTIAL